MTDPLDLYAPTPAERDVSPMVAAFDADYAGRHSAQLHVNAGLPIYVTDIAYHRNGVGGTGFYVVLFTDPTVPGDTRLAATLVDFHEDAEKPLLSGHACVFLQHLTGPNTIHSKWRGEDTWGMALRRAVWRWEHAGRPPLSVEAVNAGQVALHPDEDFPAREPW